MLRLSKGQYCSTTNKIYHADNVLAGLTNYHKDMGTSALHYHENAHLSFVLRGEMQVRRQTLLSDRTTTEHISFMHSEEVHQNTVLSRMCNNVNLELESGFFNKYGLTEAIVANGIHRIGFRGELLMTRLFKEICFYDEYSEDSIHMLLLDAASGWLRNLDTVPPWLAQVRALLHDSWQEKIGIEEIAATVNIHPVNISRYFVRYFGTTLGEYRRRIKIERAIGFIAYTHKPLAEVAYTCGFFDQSHFIRAFKEQTGLLPKDLRA
ncbi:helix-turn-helix transcriptional regulator [Mucilaginibacter lappiensis]|uniref:helix-turn-helix transcriptional regulator n=1 Tax=Mucilaginibacter lappiensis TaxID=354630 RepID=UPI003D1971AD